LFKVSDVRVTLCTSMANSQPATIARYWWSVYRITYLYYW